MALATGEQWQKTGASDRLCLRGRGQDASTAFERIKKGRKVACMNQRIGFGGRAAIVVIGRNEGERLERCLRSLPSGLLAVYVDSGSTDGSLSFARSLQVDVIELDMSIPFTAARARNVGWRRLAAIDPELEYVQFVDGDCELNPQWLDNAIKALAAKGNLAAVFGRRREIYPDTTIYNRMCDYEWDRPLGISDACGGDVLFRLTALREADGYSDTLIAGEEPDLCLRLRQSGWQIERIDAEMTLHDAAIASFSAFWNRTKRSGFAYAEHVWRHGSKAIPSWHRQLYGIAFWGLLIPFCALLCLAKFFFSGSGLALLAGLLCLAAYPLQIARIASKIAKANSDLRFALTYSALIVIGKLAQGAGVLKCWMAHLLHRKAQIIEYKGP